MSIEHNERQFGAGMGSKKSHVPVLYEDLLPVRHFAIRCLVYRGWNFACLPFQQCCA